MKYTMQNGKTLLIVSGGSIDINFSKEYIKDKKYDRIIAADSGLAHCKEIGIEPTDILGDFDSLKNKELLEEYRKKGIPLREFPTRKDYTDTHLAVKYAVDLKPQKVTILGATGTRYDHALANISLLAFLKDNGIEAKIVDVHNEIEMLHGPEERKYLRSDIKNPQNPGKEYFSIIAFSPEVTGIDEEGFSYSLKNGTLYNKESVGVSNEIMAKEATLRVKKGYLLVLITRYLLLFNSLREKRPGREPMAYICDFSRYEKSSSMKRPTLKLLILTQLYKTQSCQNQ